MKENQFKTFANQTNEYQDDKKEFVLKEKANTKPKAVRLSLYIDSEIEERLSRKLAESGAKYSSRSHLVKAMIDQYLDEM